MQIISTVGSSLELAVFRDGERLPTPLIARQPDSNRSRVDFLKRTLINLATTGNAYFYITRDSRGTAQNLVSLAPSAVSVQFETDGTKFYHVATATGETKRYSTKDIEHLRLLELDGLVYGLGPIQACRAGLGSALNLRDFTNTFTREMPNGILTSTLPLDPEVAAAYQDAVYSQLDNGGILALGSGLTFQTVQFSPADLQYLETQKFNETRIANLFGVPATFLEADSGASSYQYTNLTAINNTFYRNTLSAYLNVIEAAFSLIIPRGQTARFLTDELLRGDESTRYANYAIGLSSGFLTLDEIREREGLAPLTPAQRDELTPPAVQPPTDPESEAVHVA